MSDIRLPHTKCRTCRGELPNCIVCNGTGRWRYSEHHPLLRENEAWVGNQQGPKAAAHLAHIPGLRAVQPAFDINGEALKPDEDCWAMLVPSSQRGAFNRAMENQLHKIRTS